MPRRFKLTPSILRRAKRALRPVVRTVGTQAGPAMLVKVAKRRPFQFFTKQLTQRIPMGFGNPVAQRTFAWLTYVSYGTLNTGAVGAPASQIWNMNSIHDPDRTGAGHQPYGHDTYSTLYNRYRVHKIAWTIQCSSYGTNSTNVTVVPLNNVTTTDDVLAVEQAGGSARTKILHQSGDSNHTFMGAVDLAQLNGTSRTEYNADDRFESTFGSSPTELMGLYIFASNGASTASGIQYFVKLQYYTELFDPIPLAQS